MAGTSWTFEELGRGLNKTLYVEIEYDYEEPYSATREEPGSPGYSVPTSAKVVWFETSGGVVASVGDWAKSLDKIALGLVEAHWDEISESIGTDLADAEMAAYEAHLDAKRDEALGG